MTGSIQNDFQSYILEHSPLEEESPILNHIAATGFVSPSTGLSIYHNGYRLRLIEILENDYPKLKKIVGDEKFNSMALEYIENSPSKFFSVRYFGEGFTHFLKTHSKYSKKLYLAEMAVFEWTLGDALDAADSSLASLESLKNIPAPKWNDLKICFHPSFQMIKLYWNIPQVWQSIDNENKKISKLKKAKIPVSWVIIRSNLQSAFRSTNENESCFFELANKTLAFGEICDKLSHRMPEDQVPHFTLSCLQKWIQEGLISDFSY